MHSPVTSPAFEVAANCQDDAEDQQDNDAKSDELYLHVLPPHLLRYLCSLLLEILCLQAGKYDQICHAPRMVTEERKDRIELSVSI